MSLYLLLLLYINQAKNLLPLKTYSFRKPLSKRVVSKAESFSFKKSGVHKEFGIRQYLNCLLRQYNVATTQWKYELITFKTIDNNSVQMYWPGGTNEMNKTVVSHYNAARN